MRLAALALLLWAASAEAQPYTVLPDLRYDAIEGVDPNLLSLDVYRPLGDGPFPVVVFVHGGGWHSGDKVSTVHAKADWLAARGVLFVSVNYRLSPAPSATPAPDRLRFPTHPEDVGRAVDFVRANASAWGGDAERLALMGHSAGAHLAALVGTDPGYTTGGAPACVVALDTNAYDVPFYLGLGPGPSATATYINAFTADPATQAAASPISHLGAWPETVFLVAHQRTAPRIATAEHFLDALRAEGRAATGVTTDGLSHQEINTLIGTDAAPALTDAVGGFLGACLGVAVGAAPDMPDDPTGLSPNPTSGRVRLTLPADGGPYRVRVVDPRGRTVLRRVGVTGTDTLDLGELAPGVYSVVARGERRVVRRRVTVAR